VQNNSRKTFETLAKIRDAGRPIVLNQKNIAGVQQVNNGLAAQSQVIQVPANELLEVPKDERLDTRPPSAPSAINSQVETVDQRRRKNASRQSGKPPERIEARGQIRGRARARKRLG
jgi:hypothetical protein